ncbi:MAG: PD-(D/E)XK nuclease family protein, partial [Duncaniella sp.]|nr:PD-(D/E)XK nuclease family protein [Duncaniella sp.]
QGIVPISYNKKPLEDYRSVNDEFMAAFNSKVAEIFDPAVPFSQAEDSHACTFCNFKSVCGRTTGDE